MCSRFLVAAAATTLVVPLVAALPGTGATAEPADFVPFAKTWTIDGHGYGHGHGMSQYGAQGAALQGLSYADILNFYYPGTRSAQGNRRIRVLIGADWTSDLQVRPRRGLKVRDLTDNASWTLPARGGVDRWQLRPVTAASTVVRYHDSVGWHRWGIPDGRGTFAGDAQFRAPGGLTLLVPGGGDVVPRKYRGVLRMVQPYRAAPVRDTVNVVTLDEYVKGVVPDEMPTSWHPQALRAQAVAARTFAAWQRAQNTDRYYQICDTLACQVYGGRDAEVASTNDAVMATAGQILTYDGKPALTQFSASSGGWTAAGGVSYLPAKRDPYDRFDGNDMHDWTVTVTPASLARTNPEIGKLVSLRVTQRDGHGEWRGRVQQIVLEGTRGTASLTGDEFRWHYDLRSTWFAITPIAN